MLDFIIVIYCRKCPFDQLPTMDLLNEERENIRYKYYDNGVVTKMEDGNHYSTVILCFLGMRDLRRLKNCCCLKNGRPFQRTTKRTF